tara:strand:+ start:378 stop:1763 length:1386 start_codon:yes stop_codon:yes gene_type:complete
MKKSLFLSFILIAAMGSQAQQTENEFDQQNIKKIYTTALTDQYGYKWLKKLTDIGPRLAGSDQATQAVLDFKKLADSLGFETSLQEVRVPHWIRGEKEESYYIFNGKKILTNGCALGGSVATKKKGLKAQIVEITSFEELEAMDKKALKGKIAFFNIPMDPAFIFTFFAYGNAVKQRYVGAVEASKKGALGVIVRSLSSSVNKYPHTGSMTYADAKKKIPAMAISTFDAERLSNHLVQEPGLEFFYKMSCKWGDSTSSYNLIADFKGKEKPKDIIVVGGHIDSWDLGTGAHDDGAGSIHALESAYLLKKLGLLPKRTLRVVFFMNEEFGLNGAIKYARQSVKDSVNHVLAMESDAGGFSPRGISMVAPDSIIDQIKSLRSLLEPYGIHQFSQTGAGADIGQLSKENTVMIGMRPDGHRYFEVHHSALDTMESVNARELEMGSATFAALIYLLDKYDILISP